MNPVVSGPFMLTSWNHGQDFTMDRNPNFWGPAPTVDRVVYRIYTNQEAMIQALKNNEIDIADGLTPSLINSVSNTPDITVQKVVSDWWLNLAFNFGGQNADAHPLPALQDLTVRKAIEMAIDKNAIVNKVYQGAATTGDTTFDPPRPSGIWTSPRIRRSRSIRRAPTRFGRRRVRGYERRRFGRIRRPAIRSNCACRPPQTRPARSRRAS